MALTGRSCRKGRKGRLLEKRGYREAFHYGPSPGPLLDSDFLLASSLLRGLRPVLVPEGKHWPILQSIDHFQALRLTAKRDAALS